MSLETLGRTADGVFYSINCVNTSSTELMPGQLPPVVAIVPHSAPVEVRTWTVLINGLCIQQ